MNVDENLIADLEKHTDPASLLKDVFTRFGNKAAIGTSGQLTGSVIIDLACRTGVKPRVFTNDTLRLFPETYELFDKVEKHYGISIERFTPDPAKLKRMIDQHGEFLFFDSKDKQEFCCHLRKVEPNNRALDTLDVWITGLRADQSAARADTGKFSIVEHGPDKRPILKIAPLVDWNEKQIWEYIRQNGVPYHSLLQANPKGWFYESLGCVICTTPIGPGEPRRAGRWRWFNATDPDKKECGLHVVEKK